MQRLQHKTILLWGLAGIIGLGSLAASVLAAVSADDQQMFDQKRYSALLAQLNQELASKKTAAGDRYDLLMFKGEALLRTKAMGTAADTFTAAAKVGADDGSMAVANGTALLIKHSGPGKYQPKIKTGSKDLPQAIDIIDPTSRKEACNAFLVDLLSPLQPQLAKVDTVTSMTAILSLAKQVKDARAVEEAGTGADAQTKEMLKSLATRAGTLMNNIIKPMAEQVSTVTKDASTQQKKMGKREPANSFASLSNSDAGELNDIVNSAGQVATAAAQMVLVFGDAGDFKTIQTDAEKLVTDADKILKQYHHSTAS